MKSIVCFALLLFTVSVLAGEIPEFEFSPGSTEVPDVSENSGIWIDPTDGTFENGLSYFPTEPWPILEVCSVDYIDLYNPAYGLDPEKTYRLKSIQCCIKLKNVSSSGTIHVVVQEWGGDEPSTNNLYAQLLDISAWGSPTEYQWVEIIEITDPNVILPDEFAIGWHSYWNGGTAKYYLGLDNSVDLNWYYWMSEWRQSGYPGAYGFRFEVEEDLTGMEHESDTPAVFSLLQVSPNPAQHSVSIGFELPVHEHVSITVYDISGRPVQSVTDCSYYPSGSHEVVFNTEELGNGAYYVRMSAGDFHTAETLVIIR